MALLIRAQSAHQSTRVSRLHHSQAHVSLIALHLYFGLILLHGASNGEFNPHRWGRGRLVSLFLSQCHILPRSLHVVLLIMSFNASCHLKPCSPGQLLSLDAFSYLCMRICPSVSQSVFPLEFQMNRRKRRFEPGKLLFSFVNLFWTYPNVRPDLFCCLFHRVICSRLAS